MKQHKRFFTALIALLCGFLLCSAIPVSAALTDVKPGNASGPYIKYLTDRKIMSGYPDGRFKPEGYITRAETAVILCKTAGIKPTAVKKPSFKDVSAKHWAYPYIEAAVQAGLLSGTGSQQFSPSNKLTRAELAVLLMKVSGETIPAIAAPEGVSDVKAGHWAKQAIYAAVDAEMIPTVNKKFHPDWFVNRGEIATALGVLIGQSPKLRAAELSGELQPLTGSVYVTLPGKSESRISGKTILPVGSVIRTGSDGEADLVFPDKSSFLCKANSEIKIKSAKGQLYVKQDGANGTAVDNIDVEVSKGRMFFVLATTYLFGNQESEPGTAAGGKNDALASKAGNGAKLFAADTPADQQSQVWWKEASAKRVRVKVDMPWGVAGIRGCVGSISVSDTGQGISLLSGEATVTTGSGAPASVAPGQATIITTPSAPPPAPVPLPPAEQAAFQQQASWAMETLAQAAVVAPAPPPAPVEVSAVQETAMQTQQAAEAAAQAAVQAESRAATVQNQAQAQAAAQQAAQLAAQAQAAAVAAQAEAAQAAVQQTTVPTATVQPQAAAPPAAVMSALSQVIQSISTTTGVSAPTAAAAVVAAAVQYAAPPVTAPTPSVTIPVQQQQQQQQQPAPSEPVYTPPAPPAVISNPAIVGVTPPVMGASPTSSIADTSEYTAAIRWSPTDTVFAPAVVYTATITLTPLSRHTMNGIANNFFTVSGASSVTTTVNSDGTATVNAVFPATGQQQIATRAITGITVPATGGTPTSSIAATSEYSVSSIAWTPTAATFAAATSYSATLTITPGTSYTASGLASDFFTVSGASSVTTAVNGNGTATVTVAFPATAQQQIATRAITGITVPATGGTPTSSIAATSEYSVSSIVWTPTAATFAAVTSYSATLTITPGSSYTASGLASDFFTVSGASSVNTTVNGDGTATVIAAFAATAPIPVDIAAIPGVTSPVAGATPISAITATAQYTGTVVWSPTCTTFAVATPYTATISLTPKAGYTLNSVTANFFTVAGATATNSAGSGTVTAVFPTTETTITTSAIQGVTPPVTGAARVTAITPDSQYTGAISWSPSHSTYTYNTTYTATITVFPTSGYTVTGLSANYFNVAGATTVTSVINAVSNQATITAVFPTTGAYPLATPANYSIPVGGLTTGTTKIATLSTTGITGATKWRYKLGSGAFTTPVYGAAVTGTADYTAGTSLSCTAGQHLLLLATDSSNYVKAYADITLTTAMVKDTGADISSAFTDSIFKQRVWYWLTGSTDTAGTFSQQDLITRGQAGYYSLTPVTGYTYVGSLAGLEYFEGTGLTTLDCTGYHLTSLPTLPSTLTTLVVPNQTNGSIAFNMLASLPALPTGLTTLDVSQNSLTDLPTLPATMSTLNCSSNFMDVFTVGTGSLNARLAAVTASSKTVAPQSRVRFTGANRYMTTPGGTSQILASELYREETSDGTNWANPNGFSNLDNFTFSSSDEAIATVSSSGLITKGTADGTCYIYVKYKGVDLAYTKAQVFVDTTSSNINAGTSIVSTTSPANPAPAANFTFTVTVKDGSDNLVDGLASNLFELAAYDSGTADPAYGTITMVSAVNSGTGVYTVTAKYDQPHRGIDIKVTVKGVTLTSKITNLPITKTISSLDELNSMSSIGSYILTKNLDFNDSACYTDTGLKTYWATNGWTPIAGFNGILDGNGYKIAHLYVTSSSGGSQAGLFASLESKAIVKNLGLTDVAITCSGSAGAVTGGIYGGTINNCYSTGVINTSGSQAGGIAGENNDGTILKCSSSVSVSGVGSLGGIAGKCGSNGGIPTITNCYATGSVTGTGDYVGGIVGAGYTLNVSNTYSAGPVTGRDYVGGLAGQIGDSGACGNSNISNSFALNSAITGNSGNTVAGQVGSAGSVSNCFVASATVLSLTTNSGTGGTSISSGAAKQQSSYLDYSWDIGAVGSSTPIWVISSGSGLPYLREQGAVLPAATPVSATLAVGSTYPVGGVTNVAIPAAGATNSTGRFTGWASGTANKIKFTVVDGGAAVSTITINGSAYTSGTDYTMASPAPLTVVVTTSESGRTDCVRTFVIQPGGDISVNFTDTEFKNAVFSWLGTSGSFTYQNLCDRVTAGNTILSITNNNTVASLAGLEFFEGTGLLRLNCYWDTQLTGLPALPSSLKELYCDNSSLKTLPALPSGLTKLYANNNQLCGLPALPTSITEGSCNDNYINVWDSTVAASLAATGININNTKPQYRYLYTGSSISVMSGSPKQLLASELQRKPSSDGSTWGTAVDGTISDFTFTSSNTGVAAVSGSGEITAVGTGTCTIYADYKGMNADFTRVAIPVTAS